MFHHKLSFSFFSCLSTLACTKAEVKMCFYRVLFYVLTPAAASNLQHSYEVFINRLV